MFFYEFNAEIKNMKDVLSDVTEDRDTLCDMSSDLYDNLGNIADQVSEEKKNSCFIFLKKYSFNFRSFKAFVRWGAIASEKGEVLSSVKLIEEKSELIFTDLVIREVTFSQLLSDTHYIDTFSRRDIHEIFRDFDLDGINETWFEETLIADRDDGENWFDQQAKSYLCEESLLPELKRIFTKCPVKNRPKGHPVHYMVCIKNKENRRKITQLLTEALLANGRLENRRCCIAEYKDQGGFLFPMHGNRSPESLYRISKGGTVVIDYDKEVSENGHAARADKDSPEEICEYIKKYNNDVQTIICLTGESAKTERIFTEFLGGIPIVRISEDKVNVEKAKEYLTMLANEKELPVNESLFAKLTDPEEMYDPSSLRDIFNKWQNSYLKTEVFPQYSVVQAAEKQVAEKEYEGSAYEKLQSMIGLTEVKKFTDRALDYFKAQKVFSEMGMKADKPAMSMVFTGNPGTAKTTAARLFARILKDNDILAVGDLYELGRADIVGKYVGWTAQIVKDTFRKAKGSVVFIDEAYSLLDDRKGMYGDEAINTIVQEMENNREDVLVIFAGYPDEMKEFLDRNPGLKSRVAFHVPFADYTGPELYEIAEFIAEEKGVQLHEDVKEKLLPIFEKARLYHDFGNGRFVRNIIEKAKINQASRLVNGDIDNVTEKDVRTLYADDFEDPATSIESTERQIGFAV